MKFAKKEQINEELLLADAKLWFEQKHGKSPKECGVKFIKVWHKPTSLIKTTAVVFAPNEEIGKAFIWEQNVILRSMKNFWILPAFITIAFFSIFSQEKTENMINATIIFLAPIFFAFFFFLYLGWKCKKLEKIHKWNVEIYYP